MTQITYRSLDEARQTQSAAHPEKLPEPPRPLMRPMAPANAYPIESLGAVLGPAAKAIKDRVQAPKAICGQSVLAAATMAVQAHADVVLPIGEGQKKPLSNYFCTVAASGERKTACDTEATRPIAEHEVALRQNYVRALPDYLDDREAWNKTRQVAKKTKGDREQIKRALAECGPAPTAPLNPLLLVPEPTYEGLCKLFGSGQPSLGLFATEGGQFVGGYGMNQENKLYTATGLSALWDGEPIRRVRAGDEVLLLPGRRMTMHLMVQPGVAQALLSDPLLNDQGLLSRLLVSAPDSTAGTRLQNPEGEAPATGRDLANYRYVLGTILQTPMVLANGRTNELTPRALPMTEEAKELWKAFADSIERRVGPGSDLESIQSLANKLPEHAARIAAVLTLVGDLGATAVGEAELCAGIEIAQYHAAEALRLVGAGQNNSHLVLAQKVLDWAKAWPSDVLSLIDIYQKGPLAVRNAQIARAIAGVLENHGSFIRVLGGAVVDGVHRREAWRIVRG